MASNGRVGMRSGSPSFLVVGLSMVIVVLLYSYWSVSSRNSMLLRDQSFLQDRLRTLTSQKIAVEKKKSSVMAQVVDMEKTKRQLESNVMSSLRAKSEMTLKLKALEVTVDKEKKTLDQLQNEESKSKVQLQKLKSSIVISTEKLNKLNVKTNSLMDNYKKLTKELDAKNAELFKAQNDREVCKVKLSKLQEEHPDSRVNKQTQKQLTSNLNKGKRKNQFNLGVTHWSQPRTPPGRHSQLVTPTPIFQTMVKARQELAVPRVNVTKTVNNSNITTTPSGKIATGSATPSGNFTSKITGSNQPTTASGSNNTTDTNTNAEKVTKFKPTKKLDDESERDGDSEIDNFASRRDRNNPNSQRDRQ